LDLLKAYLHDKSMLLLLDNFEQVIAAAVQVADLLASCTKLKVLVTSRSVLHVRGEQEFPVPSLTTPDPKEQSDLQMLSQYESVALFLQQAHAALPDFQLNETNAATIAKICMQLDGLPLAIELAAARIKLLPPQALLARLEHRLRVLTGGSRDVPARHQTLRNTIGWSYQLLGTHEQRLFRRLAVFVGGCSLEAVEAVCYETQQESHSSLDQIASLIDKSLLQQVAREGESRLMMLETIREFGLEILHESGEAEQIHNAHARYFLSMAEELGSHYFDAQATVTLDLLEREFENLRTALTWLAESGETELALRLAVTLWWFWYARGHLSEGRRWVEQLLRYSDGITAALRAKALNDVGWFAYQQDDYAQAKKWFNEGLSIARQIGGKKETGVSLHRLSLVAWREEDYLPLQTYSDEALIIFNELGDKEGIADTLLLLSETFFQSEDYENSYRMREQAMALFRDLGDQWAIAYSLIELADVVFMQGDAVIARKLTEESLSISIDLGYMSVIAYGLEHLAKISAAMDEPVRAAQLWGTEEALRDGEIAKGSFLRNMPSINHESYIRSMAAVRNRLGDEAFAIAWAEGRAMTPAQALAAQGSVPTRKSAPAKRLSKHPAWLRTSPSHELTEREAEVLRLVARGLTNEQVARQLFISPRTVNSHLTTIYAKIGVSSRSGATRYAIENKLV
ncbi:MAG TPA: LuxR C-terminal-related transcriptional regulator, partial [Ktedonobacteraceae bacterium]|nr:LuxR C-terminal-related transcriptional regulator [Ktedonobacteraceae bacterium]